MTNFPAFERAHKVPCGDRTCVQHLCREAQRCQHPHKKRCGLCGENYCPNDGCDPWHVENCREAMRP